MIPRFAIQATAIGADLWEAEGHALHIRWFGWVFEITLAKIVRQFDA